MSSCEIDLLKIQRGLVVAPAGCGKTQLITEALKNHTHLKPILVLTHTNAGVAALRERLRKAGVPSARYRLSTIDGWAIRLVQMFPERAGLDRKHLTTPNYPMIRRAAGILLNAGHIDDLLRATYSRLFVDEYQDCSTFQHLLVLLVAMRCLPTVVLGDPLQAIFTFSTTDKLPDWSGSVCKYFPISGELQTPWRWNLVGAEPLGKWLLEVRQKLLDGLPIDIRQAPQPYVKWLELDGRQAGHSTVIKALASAWDNRVLVIGSSLNAESRHNLASQIAGSSVVEPVDMKQLMQFFGSFKLESEDALDHLLEFAGKLMNGVSAKPFKIRLSSIQAERARKSASASELAALRFLSTRTAQSAADVLQALGEDENTRVYRHTMLKSSVRAFQLCASNNSLTLAEAGQRIREDNRHFGRPLGSRSVGSTLLLKGLESEEVFVLDADKLDAKNLYTAITRGSKSLWICSQSPILKPGS